MERRTLWIVGMMGSGKSTVAALVAHRLGLPAVDTDERVTAESGRTIAEIFSEQGELVFRALERDAIEAVAGEACVVSLGGGAMVEPGVPERLREFGPIFYLAASPETLAARVAGEDGRPLLEGLDERACRQRLAALLAQRAPAYEKADHRIETDDRVPDAIAAAIVEALDGAS